MQTGHKPLIATVKKPPMSASKRLQNMLLRLPKDDYKLLYCPGTQVITADTPSQAIIQCVEAVMSFDEDIAPLENVAVETESAMIASAVCPPNLHMISFIA